MKILVMTFILLIVFSFFIVTQDGASMPLKVGDNAPAFKLKDETGTWRTLSEFKGTKVVLYFYPKDNTPGCTKEACSFRDGYSQIKEKGIVILGVSYDTPASHRKFIEKYHLPFTLLSDETKNVSKAYGAYKGMLQALTPKRMTFLIDENGKIVFIFEKVDVNEHAHEVLNAFGKQ